MRTDLNTLKKIAHLSRLNLDKENEQKLLEDFNKMIAFVEKLKDEIPASEALKNNPVADATWFKVPKVIK
jgi:aspartyl-tRNA(Asn)/glutamyl-tRNA(Gln) amidotransferase subunit C